MSGSAFIEELGRPTCPGLPFQRGKRMASPRNRTRFGAVLAVAILSGTSWILASDVEVITESEVELHTGLITGVRALKGSRKELTLLEKESKEKKFTVDRQTLIYQLTARNREIFAEQDKVDQIVKDTNHYRRSILELKEGEIDVVLGALGQQSTSEFAGGRAAEKTERGGKTRSVYKWRNAAGALNQSQLSFGNEEEQRRKDYGMPGRLREKQKAIVVAKRTGDDTLMVLLLGSDEVKKENALKEAAADDGEAGRKLKNIKQLINEAEELKGSERDRLLTKAYSRLREIIEKYPNTKEAEEANKLLSDK
jgi:hypothetical protein